MTAEFQKTGDDQDTHSAVGKLTLYMDTAAVAEAEIITQPGTFSHEKQVLAYITRD